MVIDVLFFMKLVLWFTSCAFVLHVSLVSGLEVDTSCISATQDTLQQKNVMHRNYLSRCISICNIVLFDSDVLLFYVIIAKAKVYMCLKMYHFCWTGWMCRYVTPLSTWIASTFKCMRDIAILEHYCTCIDPIEYWSISFVILYGLLQACGVAPLRC